MLVLHSIASTPLVPSIGRRAMQRAACTRIGTTTTLITGGTPGVVRV